VRELGKGENVRFVGMTLCRAVPDATEKLQGAATSINVEAAENPNLRRSEPDPMLVRAVSSDYTLSVCGAKYSRYKKVVRDLGLKA